MKQQLYKPTPVCWFHLQSYKTKLQPQTSNGLIQLFCQAATNNRPVNSVTASSESCAPNYSRTIIKVKTDVELNSTNPTRKLYK